ncbi:MAG: PAS domain S-box protein [Candidatus Cloacimonadota bacterium]|nr:PAS domain S-box protein [Candidatus Cloacimonadota bacterium]
MNDINNSDKKRILIIDDNTQIHLDFKKVLLISKEKESDLDKLEEALIGKTPDIQDETYSIDYASQGKEGFKMVEESIREREPYAVAFIDVRMPPGWDGIETISKIWEIYPDLQIVICTAYSDYSWDDLFKKFGHTDKLLILKKPFDNIEVRQLTYTLSKKWELNRIASLKLNELERNVKKRTKELQQSEEKYRTMIENSNDMIWTLDKEGNFLYINKRSEEVTEGSAKQEIGKSFAPIILEEDLELVQNVFLDTLAGNQNHYEVRIYDRTRTNIITISVNTAPIIKEGKVIGTVSFGRDITKRKQMETKIKQKEKMLRQIIDTTPNSMFVKDRNGKYLVVNKQMAKLYNTTPEDLIGKYDYEIGKKWFKTIDYNKFRKNEQNVIDNKKIFSTNAEPFIFKQGIERWFQTTKIPFEMEDDPNCILIISTDITELKQVEKKLKIGRKRLQIVNSILRHDIANDLVVIKSALNIFNNTSNKEMLIEIEKRVSKGLSTIERQRKQEYFIDSHSDLVGYKINDIVENLQKNYPQLKINISGSETVYANNDIYSVFDNLISNSIIHGKSTKLNIEISSRKYLCEIKISDNGKGIPKKIQNKIFDKGFAYGKTGNTGIGLHIVKQIIEYYGGTIFVRDNEPDGAAFVINLRKVIE